ncbi:putative Short-chain dehydrogenase family protein [Aspergillus mulundensis]|uniref:Putative Short-chain dehydrogenase family protein n=1 Tax=Aspergillus mulundensis TaxID=1810919 RepID=A0A3D8T4G7_9EURO|nr:putative Short-chain dehydrogenase family protein [Aspergillus mulundensis]RDW93457.1 putative Short-chain dehydrogenase family protein [Aspergillus mulundensis]
MADFTPAQIQKRATQGAFIKRQLFVEPPITSIDDANLAGKTAIVTGSNTGIGFECCQQLLDLGLSKLVIAVRTVSKGEESKRQLLARKPSTKCQVEVTKLDLSSYDSILTFVEYAKGLERLDIVINNAGLLKRTFKQDPNTGHEETIQVNHLGNSLLIILLIPVLQSKNTPTDPGRLSFVNSDTPSWAKFKEKDAVPLLPGFDRPENFVFDDRYSTSKLLGQLFLKELASRIPASVVVINCSNPGLCKSGLSREFNGSFLGYIAQIMHFLLARTSSVGARSVVDAAVNHGAKSHGQYIEDGEVAPMAPFVYKPEGEKIAKRLWQETMDELAFAGVTDIINSFSSSK